MLTALFNPAPARPATRPTNRVAEYFAAPAAYPVDVREDADRLYVEVDVPGFAKDEVEVTLEGQTLTLVAEHKAPAVDAPTAPAVRGEFLLNERRTPAKLHRSFKLPPTVGDQAVNATLEHGVLTVTLAKREEAKPRKISVL